MSLTCPFISINCLYGRPETTQGTVPLHISTYNHHWPYSTTTGTLLVCPMNLQYCFN